MDTNQHDAMAVQTMARMVARADAQDWPTAALYVVATPIGNLIDLGLRAWQALVRCDVIAAEDTRASRALMDAWGIQTPLMAAHRHNEAQAAQNIIARLQNGERVALVSDAGAPAVSDPGARIVSAVRAAGLRVVPIPGPSAVIAALMASGATSDANPAFMFAGFIPPKAGARRAWLKQWCFLPAPVIMFESPHRLRAALSDIASICGPERNITLARELTKRFEQIETMAAGDALGWIAEDSHRQQGEFVVIVHEAPSQNNTGDVGPADVALMDALLETLSVKDAARVATRVGSLSRDSAYRLALERSDVASSQ